MAITCTDLVDHICFTLSADTGSVLAHSFTHSTGKTETAIGRCCQSVVMGGCSLVERNLEKPLGEKSSIATVLQQDASTTWQLDVNVA